MSEYVTLTEDVKDLVARIDKLVDVVHEHALTMARHIEHCRTRDNLYEQRVASLPPYKVAAIGAIASLGGALLTGGLMLFAKAMHWG